MANQPRPAHEVLVEKIKQKAEMILDVQQVIEKGGVKSSGMFIPASVIRIGELQEIGAFCVMCEVLDEMIIPKDALGGIITELETITYDHLVLQSTIERLRERK